MEESKNPLPGEGVIEYEWRMKHRPRLPQAPRDKAASGRTGGERKIATSKEIRANILSSMSTATYVSTADLAAIVDVNPSTISAHFRKLIPEGRVVRSKQGYRLKA